MLILIFILVAKSNPLVGGRSGPSVVSTAGRGGRGGVVRYDMFPSIMFQFYDVM